MTYAPVNQVRAGTRLRAEPGAFGCGVPDGVLTVVEDEHGLLCVPCKHGVHHLVAWGGDTYEGFTLA